MLALLADGVPATVKKYPLPVLLTVFQKVGDALAFAHSRHVIHRDLKPENIMLGDFGSVLLMDWGLAKVIGQKEAPAAAVARSAIFSARAADGQASETLAGPIMGTPAYMSPEQARGEIDALGAAGDIYALGAILFEILHLRPAVTGRAALDIVDKVTRGEVEWSAPSSSPGGPKVKKTNPPPASLLADLETSKPPAHQFFADRLRKILSAQIAPEFIVRPEGPITTADSEPEPDVAIVRGPAESYRHAHPATAELVAEIAVTSVAIDRVKAQIYAEAGVKEYWIVCPEEKVVEVYRQPSPSGYGERIVVAPPALLECVALTGVRVDLATFFA